MRDFELTEEVLGYVTAENPTNTDPRHLVGGSRNVLIDQQRKIRTRNGFTRLGVADETIAPIRGGTTWGTSTGTEIMVRSHQDKFEAYFETIDGVEINAWKEIASGFGTLVTPRFTTWYDATENLDELIFIWGTDEMFEWSGAVTTLKAASTSTLEKNGTDTWAESRFYTGGNKVVIINGTEYTYTGGEDTTILTGVTPDPSGEAVDSLVTQKIVTQADKPEADRINNTIYTYENQICLGSESDQLVYISKNTDYADFAYSTPRVPGEGVLLTLDGVTNGFATLSERLIVFAGSESIFQGNYVALTVGTTKTETLEIKKYEVGVSQSALNQETIVPIGNSILYVTQEPALRELLSLAEVSGGRDPQTLSNPIKPDFDAADFTNACSTWYKNAFYLTAPNDGVMFILEYKEDADGRIRRYWQPPQTIPVRVLLNYNSLLYGHSSAIPETYELFVDGIFSDLNSSDEKVSMNCVAKFAYRSYSKKAQLKNFDEYFTEGEISASTTLDLNLYYDFGGYTRKTNLEIDGGNFDISEETLEASSLAQQPLGQNPLGGTINAPDGTLKFRSIHEIAKEDFFEMQAVYSTDDVDKYWAILSHGANAKISTRQPINKKI